MESVAIGIDPDGRLGTVRLNPPVKRDVREGSRDLQSSARLRSTLNWPVPSWFKECLARINIWLPISCLWWLSARAAQEPTRAEFHCCGLRDRYGEIVRTWSLCGALHNGQCRVLGLLKLEPHCCRSTCSGDRPLWSEKINALKVGSESAAVSEKEGHRSASGATRFRPRGWRCVVATLCRPWPVHTQRRWPRPIESCSRPASQSHRPLRR